VREAEGEQKEIAQEMDALRTLARWHPSRAGDGCAPPLASMRQLLARMQQLHGGNMQQLLARMLREYGSVSSRKVCTV
jgi:hypothetical protein